MRNDTKRFPHVVLRHPENLSALRWTVDHDTDLAWVRATVERLGERRHPAGLDAIRAALAVDPALPPGAPARC